MNLDDIAGQLAGQLATIAGLRVYAHPDDSIEPPAAVVTMPNRIDFHDTYGQGAVKLDARVVLLVGASSPRAASKVLGGYCATSGASSIKSALESATAGYTAMDAVTVAGIDFDVYQVGAVSYPAAIFEIDIYGS